MNTPAARSARDRVYFGGMGLAFAALVFFGFGPTFYWSSFGEGITHTALGVRYTNLFRVHGAVFTAWVVCFLVQTFLVARRRVAIHRRLGYAGAVLAAAMVVLGVLVSIEMARQGISPPGVDPLAFMIVPVGDMVLFGGFVAAAIAWRRDAQTHKRLMVVAYACLLVATFSRIPVAKALGPGAPVVGAFLPLIIGMVYDRVVHGRVHRAYVWGLAILLISGLRVPMGNSAMWHAIASRLIS